MSTVVKMDLDGCDPAPAAAPPATSTKATKSKAPASAAAASRGSKAQTVEKAVTEVPEQFPRDHELKVRWNKHNRSAAKELAPGDKIRDVLIFIANDREMQAALRFIDIQYQTNVVAEAGTTEPAFVGIMPCVKKKSGELLTVLLMQSAELGPSDQGSLRAQAMLQNAIHAGVKPGMVLALGCCGGYSEQEQRLFEVAVSQGILNYERVKWDTHKDEDRNEIRYILEATSKTMIRMCRSFRFVDDDEEDVRAHYGIVLCGDKLVNNKGKKAQVMQRLNVTEKGEVGPRKCRIVGIEMEGTGTANAVLQLPNPMPWVLIKGISDWAKDKNASTEEVQETKAQEEHPSIRDDLMEKFPQIKATYAAFAYAASMLEHLAKTNALPRPQTLVADPTLKEINAGRRNQIHLLRRPQQSAPPEVQEGYRLCVECVNAHDEKAEAEAMELERQAKIEDHEMVQTWLAAVETAKARLSKKMKQLTAAREAAAQQFPAQLDVEAARIAAAEAKEQLLQYWKSHDSLDGWQAMKLDVEMDEDGTTRQLKRMLNCSYQNYTPTTLKAAGIDISKYDMKHFMKVDKDCVEVVERDKAVKKEKQQQSRKRKEASAETQPKEEVQLDAGAATALAAAAAQPPPKKQKLKKEAQAKLATASRAASRAAPAGWTGGSHGIAWWQLQSDGRLTVIFRKDFDGGLQRAYTTERPLSNEDQEKWLPSSQAWFLLTKTYNSKETMW